MSKSAKIWLIVAGVLIIVGIVLFVIAASSAWELGGFNSPQYEVNVYDLEEDFDKISADVLTAKVEFVLSTDGTCRVECHEEQKLKHTVSVKNGKLVIEGVDTRKWYEHFFVFNFGFNFEGAKITVYLPKSEYSSLSVNTAVGDVVIPSDFTFENVDIKGATADVELKAAVSEYLRIETATGRITVDGVSAKVARLNTSTGAITLNSVNVATILDIETTTGTTKLTDITCDELTAESTTGSITLNNVIADNSFYIETNTGSVRFENCDAKEIRVRTSTGSIRGTLLSDKVFTTKTSTGSVNVPQSGNGGKCDLTTSTGSIDIKINSD